MAQYLWSPKNKRGNQQLTKREDQEGERVAVFRNSERLIFCQTTQARDHKA